MSRFNRETITYLELDLDSAPAPLNTYRFCDQKPKLGAQAVRALQSVTVITEKADPAQGIGRTSTATAVIKDYPFPGSPTAALDRITALRVLRSQDPYYTGRGARVRRGLVGDDPSSIPAEEYIIESMSGPSAGGLLTVKLTTPIRELDDERVKVPEESNARLLSDIDTSLDPFELEPVGIGATLPASGYGCVGGSEFFTYTRVDDVITPTQRGGTFAIGSRNYEQVADSHQSGDSFQPCDVYANQRADSIVYDLVTKRIDPSKIDLAQWTAEADTWLGDQIFTNILTEPSGLRSVVKQVLEQAQAYMVWSATENLFKLYAVKPPRGSAVRITDDIILEGSWSEKDLDTRRVSRLYSKYFPRDPTFQLPESRNFQRRDFFVELDSESPAQWGRIQSKDLEARWITSIAQIVQLGTRTIKRYRDIPKEYTFDIDIADFDGLNLAIDSFLELSTWYVSDATGPIPTLCQVTSVQQISNLSKVTLTVQTGNFNLRNWFIGPNTLVDYSLETDENREQYGFISNNAEPYFTNPPGDAYRII